MSRKLTYAFIAGLAFTVSGLATNPAHALLFDWSFTSAVPFDNPGGIISGTIDGLLEGDNDGTGLTIEVLSTPTGELLGGGWEFFDVTVTGVAFTVTGGEITFASSDSVPAGHVISQNPVSGASVSSGSDVELVVSLGPTPVLVPDVVGLELLTAEGVIVDAGLIVGSITFENSDTVSENHIIGQEPVGGSSAVPGSAESSALRRS